MVSERVFQRFYPDLKLEKRSLGGAAAFYDWVRQYTNPRTVMLNLGAGGPAPRDKIRVFKGEVARVAGADIDPEAVHNPAFDVAHVINGNADLPSAADIFDM